MKEHCIMFIESKFFFPCAGPLGHLGMLCAPRDTVDAHWEDHLYDV